MSDPLDLDEIFGESKRRLKRSKQQIRDEHGPVIEERAKEGAVSKILAKADEADDLLMAERVEQGDISIQQMDEVAERANKKGPDLYRDMVVKCKADLLKAPYVPLVAPRAEVVMLNGVPWQIKEGYNEVPWPIKSLYDNNQKARDEVARLKKCLHMTSDPTEEMGEPKPTAYYDDVLLLGYRGEVVDAHDKRSRKL